MVRITDIEVLEDNRVVLVLHDGALPRAMSTHEMKVFAYEKMFGGLLADIRMIQKDQHSDKMYLLNQAVLTVRAALELEK